MNPEKLKELKALLSHLPKGRWKTEISLPHGTAIYNDNKYIGEVNDSKIADFLVTAPREMAALILDVERLSGGAHDLAAMDQEDVHKTVAERARNLAQRAREAADRVKKREDDEKAKELKDGIARYERRVMDGLEDKVLQRAKCGHNSLNLGVIPFHFQKYQKGGSDDSLIPEAQYIVDNLKIMGFSVSTGYDHLDERGRICLFIHWE